jgi:4-amino-4-deoxy-L-arabinose transferase-like glycosyltransferase
MKARTSPSRGKWWNRIGEWAALHPYWALTFTTVLVLGPFLAKPFNMDDPLFIWAARQIHAHPLDPYGFSVNWEDTASPMWSVTENPPLACYYLALASGALGWSEAALHAAFLLPALAVILGTYRLARRWCERPAVAALAVLFAPVFLVSSNTVMCDVLLLALWVWAVVWWVEGMEKYSFLPLAGAGLLMALAVTTKYFGICLVPLLAVYGLARRRRIGWWACSLLVPLLAVCAWQWATRSLYQQDLFLRAFQYADRKGSYTAGARVAEALVGVTFTGGCFAMTIFLSPWLWRARTLLAIIGGAVLLSLGILSEGTIWKTYHWIQGGFRLSVEAQIILWSIGGVMALALAAEDVWKSRDARAWLLALWVAGTFVFAAVFNWTVNGRSILPMAPAVGILVARRLEQRAARDKGRPAIARRRIVIPLAAGALLALLVARSDFLLAVAVRKSAITAHELYGGAGHTLWFQGHWGFQYYLAGLGGREVDTRQSPPRIGDVLAVPLKNTSVNLPPGPKQGFDVQGPRFLIDMDIYSGAGFYSAVAGPLPFVFGRIPPEAVVIYTLKSGP